MKTAGYIKTLCRPHSARIKTIGMMTLLSALLGCQARVIDSTVPPVTSDIPALELWKKNTDMLGDIEFMCRIPWGEHVVRMGDNSFGCPNDKAVQYRLSNVYPLYGKPTIIAFYDKKCDDDDRFDDDYYKYRLTGSIENFWPNSLAPDLPLGEVTEGLTYFEGYYDNGIDGYLSCVKISV